MPAGTSRKYQQHQLGLTLESQSITLHFLQAQVRQQEEFESILRALMIGIGTWEFDPMDLENPFPNNEGSVHLWQGDEDGLVQLSLQRNIAKQLPWIHYYELPGAGHMFPYADGMTDAVLKSLLIG